jgi:hypothetical protein
LSETCRCRSCGQLLPSLKREGVWLSAMKASIFDFIDAHPGVRAEGILYHCFAEGKINGVRQHVFQINALLAGTDTRIFGNAIGARGEYRIVRGSAAVGRAPGAAHHRARTAEVEVEPTAHTAAAEATEA